MTLALPRTLNEARAKERASLAKKAGALYRTEVQSCHYLDGAFNVHHDGLKPVVLWGDELEPAWTGPIYTNKAKDRKLAAYHAEIAADELRRYYLMHDHRRYDVDRREEWAAKKAEERRVMDLRKAFTNDRLAFYDALNALERKIVALNADCHPNIQDELNKARCLLDQHHEGAEALRTAQEKKQ